VKPFLVLRNPQFAVENPFDPRNELFACNSNSACHERKGSRLGGMRPLRKVNSEFFICDKCGNRKRLDSTKRHWCDNCTRETPVEMRAVRDKRTKLVAA
jgi:hypothetical protein